MSTTMSTTRSTALKQLLTLMLCSVPVWGAAPRNELHFCMAGDPKTFDPLMVTESHSEMVRYLTAGVLVRVNRVTDQVQPELAESWKITEGGRTITFRLRAGLKFSDGSALSAGDVARTFHRALDPKTASPAGDILRASGGDPELTVISPRDIAIRYKNARAGLDRLFDSLAVSPLNPGRLPASAGPFFVAEYSAGSFVRLARNPHYWKRDPAGRQLPYLDSIRIDIQQNHDIERARFLRGELDLIAPLEPESFERISKDKPGTARTLGPSLDSEFLWFNESPAKTLPEWKRTWFTSAVFRHAVSGAIHRDDIARIAFRGHAHPAAGPISTANRFWFNAALKPPQTSAAAALKALANAGFILRDGVLRDSKGHAVEFSLATNSGNQARARIAPLIQSDLREIGIRVNIVSLDFGSLVERMTKSLDYEAILLGFANVDPDPGEEMNVWLSSGAQHAWWPAEKTPATPWEARIDELELRQASEATREGRKKAIDELQRVVVEQEPIVYLVNPDYLYAVSPALHGMQPGVAPPQILWNVEWLRLE